MACDLSPERYFMVAIYALVDDTHKDAVVDVVVAMREEPIDHHRPHSGRDLRQHLKGSSGNRIQTASCEAAFIST